MNKKAILFLVCVLLCGCAIRKDLETPYSNPSNQPDIDDGQGKNGTKFCSPDTNGKFDPDAIVITSGLNADKSGWAEGGGCVMRPIRDTWAVFHNIEAMKWDAADSETFARTVNPKAGFTHLYEVTYSKSTIIGPIDWTIDWYHSFDKDKGTFAAPGRVIINYQRVRGTSNIPVWRGGIVLTKVDKNVTSIAIRNEFKARQSTTKNEGSARDGLKEMIDKARTVEPNFDRLDSGQ